MRCRHPIHSGTFRRWCSPSRRWKLLLRARAAEHPSVTVELGLEAFALTQTAQQVALQLRSNDGQVRSVTASYVIACDGASSPIRQLLDLKLDDLGFDEPWMVIDVRVIRPACRNYPRRPRNTVTLHGPQPSSSDRAIIAGGRSCCFPTRTLSRWKARAMSGGCFLPGSPRRMVNYGAPAATAFTHWLRHNGVRGGYSFGRCRSPAAAVYRPGYVPGHPRRKQPGVEDGNSSGGPGR